jgi:hypothetical protein
VDRGVQLFALPAYAAHLAAWLSGTAIASGRKWAGQVLNATL